MSTTPATTDVTTPGTDEALRKALAATPRPPRASALSAALTFGWRGMLKVKHVPEQLLDATITPVMFVLMFTYLFGGEVAGSTGEYLDYILPGVLVMSVLFTTVYSGIALNTDLTKGVVDRFRTLPIWRPAPLLGSAPGRHGPLRRGRHRDRRARRRSWASARRRASAASSRRSRSCSSSPSASRGSSRRSGCCMRSPSAVMNAGFMAIFPLTFLSNVFVDPETLPSALKAFVDVNPISSLVSASRGLMGRRGGGQRRRAARASGRSVGRPKTSSRRRSRPGDAGHAPRDGWGEPGRERVTTSKASSAREDLQVASRRSARERGQGAQAWRPRRRCPRHGAAPGRRAGRRPSRRPARGCPADAQTSEASSYTGRWRSSWAAQSSARALHRCLLGGGRRETTILQYQTTIPMDHSLDKRAVLLLHGPRAGGPRGPVRTTCAGWRAGARVDWAEGQYYVEPKRLARLGYPEARRAGQDTRRTVYALTDKGWRRARRGRRPRRASRA